MYTPITDHQNIYRQYISRTPIGYCYLEGHRGALTPSLYKKHECAKKQCPFFKKNEEHPHWVQKKKNKQKKALAKQKSK